LISFVSKTDNLSQIEAVKYLIDRYQLQVPDDIQDGAFKKLNQSSKKKKNYFDLCHAVSEWACQKLLENENAKKYIRQRSIGLKQIKYFKIGYFPGGVRPLKNFLKEMSAQGFLAKDLIEAGILMEGRSVLYSPFEERILFPIKDSVGRNCGFGGRIFKDEDKRAKYYNSKESEWFSKRQLLFGLDLAKKEMQNKGHAFLVEGYTDCVAMVKHGFLNTVATLGTACSQEHLKILSRYIETLYVLFDGDQAGQKAILRLTQFCWNVNLELQIIKLPTVEDPASFLNSGGDLNALIAQSLDIFNFFIESLGSDFSNNSLSEKLTLVERIISLIARIEDPFKQELLLQKACGVMQLPFSALKDLLLKQKSKISTQEKTDYFELENVNKEEKKGQKNSKSNGKSVPLLEVRIFSAIINNVDKADKFYVETDLLPYFSEYIQFLLGELESCRAKTTNSYECFDAFLNYLDDSDRDWVIQSSLKFEQDVSKDLFDQLIFHFCRQNWKQIVRDLKLKLTRAKQTNNSQKLKELFLLFSKLKRGIQDRGLI